MAAKSLHRALWGDGQKADLEGRSRRWEQQELWPRGMKPVWGAASSSGLLGCKGQNWDLVQRGS